MSTTETDAQEQVLATAQGDRDLLLEAFRPAARAVGKSSGGPSAFAVVRVRCDQTGVFAEASDGKVSVRVPVPLQVSMGDEWDVQVSPRIADVVRAISGGSVELQMSGSQMEIRGPRRSKYKIPMYSHQWPNIEFMDEADFTKLPKASTATMLELARASRFASEGSGNRPALSGVNVRMVDGKGLICGTDSFRLYTAGADDVKMEEAATIPTEMIETMTSVFGANTPVVIAFTKNTVVMGADSGARVSARRIDGNFPDPSIIIPKDDDIELTVTLDRRFFLDALERLSTFFQGNKPVKLTIDQNEMELSITTDLGEGHEFVDLTDGPEDQTAIAFNPKHLLDGLKQFDSSKLKLHIISSTRPMIVRGDTNEDRQFVISTVRVP